MKVSRPVVCPAKAGVFSGRQSRRGKSQKPRSLDSRVEGNRNSEAYRQCHLRGGSESPGRNESERIGGLESEKPRRPSPQPWGEGSMGSGRLALTADPLRRGGSDSMVTRTR